MEQLNVNLIMSGKCDENIVNIGNVFDKIKINNENRASFYVITLLNGYGEKCFKKITLFYYLMKLEEDGDNPYMLLGETSIVSTDDEKCISTGEPLNCSQSNSIQEMIRNYYEDVYFLGKGQYELQVYLYADDEIPKNNNGMKRTTEEKKKIKNINKLVAIYNFEVN